MVRGAGRLDRAFRNAKRFAKSVFDVLHRRIRMVPNNSSNSSKKSNPRTTTKSPFHSNSCTIQCQQHNGHFGTACESTPTTAGIGTMGANELDYSGRKTNETIL